MSLRDQLLKAGLASEKQAKRADRAAREEKKRKRKTAKAEALPADEVQEKIKQELAERKERDRQLNLSREADRRAKEALIQAKEYVYAHDQREWRADQPYYFLRGEGFI